MTQKTGKIDLPEGKSIALTLTFDFDASSVWMSSFGKTSPAYMSRGEYGACVAVPRILDLLDVAMHPQVSGRPHMIAMLEEFIQYALGKGAWIAPFRDVLQRMEF